MNGKKIKIRKAKRFYENEIRNKFPSYVFTLGRALHRRSDLETILSKIKTFKFQDLFISSM